MFTEDACFLSKNSNLKTYTSVSLYNKIKKNEKVLEKSKRLKFWICLLGFEFLISKISKIFKISWLPTGPKRLQFMCAKKLPLWTKIYKSNYLPHFHVASRFLASWEKADVRFMNCKRLLKETFVGAFDVKRTAKRSVMNFLILLEAMDNLLVKLEITLNGDVRYNVQICLTLFNNSFFSAMKIKRPN